MLSSPLSTLDWKENDRSLSALIPPVHDQKSYEVELAC